MLQTESVTHIFYWASKLCVAREDSREIPNNLVQDSTPEHHVVLNIQHTDRTDRRSIDSSMVTHDLELVML